PAPARSRGRWPGGPPPRHQPPGRLGLRFLVVPESVRTNARPETSRPAPPGASTLSVRPERLLPRPGLPDHQPRVERTVGALLRGRVLLLGEQRIEQDSPAE